MKYLILLGYLILIPTIVFFLYYKAGFLMKMSQMSHSELNEIGEIEEDKIQPNEASWFKRISGVLFSLMGIYLWSMVSVTLGCIANEITSNSLLKWALFFPICFIILRVIYGTATRMIMKVYEIEKKPSFIILSISLSWISALIISFGWNDSIPIFLNWHLNLMLS